MIETYDIKKLGTEGAVVIPYPPDLLQAVADAMRLWQKFTALPADVKKGLPYSNGSDGVGYELKDGTGNKGDSKENLDVAVGGQDWLKENLSRIEDPVAREFVSSATSLVSVMKPTIMRFARDVEREFGIPGFADEVEASEAGFFVRFIHYFGDRKAGEETASAHVDQSGFTLHLSESAPGFETLSLGAQEWQGATFSGDATLIINSMQMQQRSEGKLTALCHRVVATEETAKSGRWSAVCFVQLQKTPKYDKSKCGRLQERKPGFNYGMPFAEFREMFM